MTTESKHNAPLSPKDQTEERKRRIQLQQYACNGIKNKKHPTEVIKELVEQGMEEQEATDLVNHLQKVDMSETEIEADQRNWRKTVIGGTIVTIIGIAITVYTYIEATTEGGDFIITYGLIVTGLAIMGTGFSRRPRRKKDDK